MAHFHGQRVELVVENLPFVIYLADIVGWGQEHKNLLEDLLDLLSELLN